jgi:hypothetical protein
MPQKSRADAVATFNSVNIKAVARQIPTFFMTTSIELPQLQIVWINFRSSTMRRLSAGLSPRP